MQTLPASNPGPATTGQSHFTQDERAFAVSTPLGKDKLLLAGFKGYESISSLFNFQLDLLAESETEIQFDRILGQTVTVRMQIADDEQRYFHGLINRFSQGERDEVFTQYRAELVPDLWLLTKKIRSRIFQHLSVPDILHQVLSAVTATYELVGVYHPRDYCVQYRESDFDFVSRLMEEEGIYYFFKHAEDSHTLVLTDLPNQHPPIPEPNTVVYGGVYGGVKADTQILTWEKTQQLRSGEYTLRDHCFELPGNNLEAKERTGADLKVGKVTHKLDLASEHQLEIYDYPGGYAQRFDGVDSGGVPRPQNLRTIFEDRQRTVRIRMEQEEAGSLEIAGTSDCGHFVAGHRFTLQRHVDADGQYLLTRVEHDAQLSGYRREEPASFSYANRFTCVPIALPYRPQRVTKRPSIAGIQTATVVGPRGEEIFCDKYGRVKVQFHWDRDGKKDAGSSCWLRVAQAWAGNGWGAFFWPRIGHEVVVAFEEGDPDQPLIIGSVYNAENMPPFALPENNQLTGLKSASFRGRPSQNYNGIVFDDTNGKEHLSIHSERHLSLNSELEKLFSSGRHKAEHVSNVSMLTVGTLPGGGGSGGGGDPYSAMQPPQAVGAVGLNGIMVYGENLQAALGLNHQFALGSNLQICINPGGLAAGVTGAPSCAALTGLVGSGLGGNMQLTIGTSASIVMGRSFDINLGPKKIEVAPGETSHPDSIQFGALLGMTYLAWMLFYGLLTDNKARSAITLTAQIIIDLLLGLLMRAELVHKEADIKADQALKKANGVKMESDELDDTFGQHMALADAVFDAGVAIIAAAVTPAIADYVTAQREKDSSSS